MTKSEARKIYSQKRKSITDKEKLLWNDLLLIQFQNVPLPDIVSVFSYIAMEKNNEIDTRNIINYLKFKNPGLLLAYPVCDFNSWTMDAIVVDERTTFGVNRFSTIEPCGGDILSPKDIDLVIVPLLCLDEEGYRVGYGKGFYDKYFQQTKPGVIKIGLAYFAPIEKIQDRNEFDVPLDYCITPQCVYEF